MERALKHSLYALLILLPVFWLPVFFESWEFPKQLLLLVLGLLVFVLTLFQELKQSRFRIFWPYDALVSVFLIIAVSSTIFSLDRLVSVFGFYGRFSQSLTVTISLAMVYFAVSRYIKDQGLGLLNCLAASGLLAALPSWFFIFVKHSNFNLMAASLEALSMILTILIFLALSLGKNNKFYLALIFSALGLIFLIDYLPSLIVLILAAVFYLVWLGLQSFSKDKPLLLIVLIIFITGLIGLVFNASKLSSFAREVTLSYPASWQISLDVFKEKPILGSGLGTFAYDFSRHRPALFNQDFLWQIRFDRPKSHLAELLATTGIFGLISFLSLAGLGLKTKTSLFFAFSASVIVSALYYQNLILSFMFWVLLAGIAGLKAADRQMSLLKLKSLFNQENLKARLIILFALLVLSLAFVFLGLLFGKIYAADFFYSQGFRKSTSLEKVNLLEKAGLLNPSQAEYQVILCRSLLNYVRETAASQSSDQFLSLISQAIEAGKKAVILSPNWIAGWETLGMTYQEIRGLATGAEDQAIIAFNKAIELEPSNPLLYANLGRIYFGQNNLALARENFIQAKMLKPDYLDAQIFLGLIKEKQFGSREAIKSFEHLRGFYVLDIQVAFQLGRLYFNQGDMEKAAEQFIAALKINPNHLDSLYSLALVREKQGEKGQAIDYLEKALELSPQNQTLLKKRQDLTR